LPPFQDFVKVVRKHVRDPRMMMHRARGAIISRTVSELRIGASGVPSSCV
jgi:hypothetical protein